jgi:hypothetical protein
MTEAEWFACTSPASMLDFLSGKVSDRKLRLFTVACCDRVKHLVPDELGQQEFKVPDVFTVGQAEEMDAWLFRKGLQAEASMFAPEYQPAHPALQSSLAATANVCWATARIATRASRGKMFGPVYKAGAAAQASLLRDIIGNPFRGGADASIWLSQEAVLLANQVYDEGIFDRLAILADELEDAGCHDTGILGHCRGTGPHVRGCWVVDLILGKK